MTGSAPPNDDFERHFWLDTARVGGWVTIVMVLAVAVYTAAFAPASARLGLGITDALTAVLGALVLRAIPWRRVVASPVKEVLFLTWSLLTIVSVSVMAGFDGGAMSPLTVALLLPVVFASLAYGPAHVLLVAVLAEVAFASLTLIGPAHHGYDLVLASVLLGTAVMAVSQARFHETWRTKLSESSRTDPLTGVLNRRGLAEAATAAFAGLDRYQRPVTLLVIDLDVFKSYNDIHGHQAGDELLGWVAARLGAVVRPNDTVARIGGDEFTVLLPDTTEDGAEPIINRIREALETRIGHCIGWAVAPADGTSFEELYRSADAALYQSKLLLGRGVEDVTTAESPVERRKHLHPLSADAILAGVTEAFFVLDDEWRFVYVNKAAGAMLERAAHELLGQVIWDAFPAAVGSQFEQVYRRVLASGRSERFVEHYEPLGTTFSVRASPIPGGLSVYFHDVSAEAEVFPRGPRGAALATREAARRPAA
jgi:diguanylate cyclase (GGDEF)-like protein